MKEEVLLHSTFQQVVGDIAAGRGFSSDLPREQKAFAVHSYLLQKHLGYQQEFARYQDVGHQAQQRGLEKRIQQFNLAAETSGPIRTFVKGVIMLAPFSVELFKIYRAERRLLQMAVPILDKSIQ